VHLPGFFPVAGVFDAHGLDCGSKLANLVAKFAD
jgi:hypothetical protein